MARSPGVFISYRRADAAGEAGRLADHLALALGERAVFIDVAGIELGSDWRQRLDAALDGCDTMLVVIGRQWCSLPSTLQPGLSRLDDAGDMVAWEVQRGLARGLRMIQVLVQDAAPPEPEQLPATLAALAMRQALRLRHENFAADVQGLAAQIRQARRSRSPWTGDARASDLSRWARVLDSGPEGTCLAVSIVNAMELLLARAGQPRTLSLRYLYEKSREHDGTDDDYEGAFALPIFFVASFHGVPEEAIWPYVPGQRRLPGRLDWPGLERRIRWRCRAEFFRTDGLADAVRQLGAGRPVVAQVHCLGDVLMRVGRDGRVGMPEAQAEDQGLTTLLLTGYQPEQRAFRALGTWGSGHGDGGFYTLPLEVARRLIDPEGLWSVQLSSDMLAELREARRQR